MIARVVLADIPYAIDRPYDYLVPEQLEETIRPGCRVTVPFSSKDMITDGFVIARCESSPYPD